MSSYPPPQPHRRLERSRSNRVLGGVCSGVANYLNLDPTLVRVLTVLISSATGVPIILYLIGLFVIPEEGDREPPQNYPPVNGNWTYDPYPGTVGQDQPGQHYGPAASADEAVWGAQGAPWEQPQPRQPPGTPTSPQRSTWESAPTEPSTEGTEEDRRP